MRLTALLHVVSYLFLMEYYTRTKLQLTTIRQYIYIYRHEIAYNTNYFIPSVLLFQLKHNSETVKLTNYLS